MKKRYFCSLLVMILLLGSVYSCVFAATKQEAGFLIRLWGYTQNSYNRKALDLKPALGTATFEGIINTGIADTRPYIRGESAKIVYQFGDSSHILALQTKAAAETDLNARDSLYLYLTMMQLKYSQDKPTFIASFLQAATQSSTYGSKGTPQSALRYIIQEAMDAGVSGAQAPLLTLRDGEFINDAEMTKLINAARTSIDLYAQYQPQGIEALAQAALGNTDPLVQAWGVHFLVKTNALENQQSANKILGQLLSQKNGQVFDLFPEIQDSGILRAENPNAALEIGDTFPQDWQITQKSAQAVVSYITGGAASFQRCLKVSNPDQTSTVISTYNPIIFEQKLPYAVEYGFAYKLAYADSGPTIIYGPGVATQVLKLKAILTYLDGTSETKDVSRSAPYEFWWQRIQGSIVAAKPIQSARLEISVSGKVNVFLDDIYIRRQGSEYFKDKPPVISSISLSSPAVLISGTTSEYVTFKAVVSDPDGDEVKGYWYSSLEGFLGEGLEYTKSLTKEGTHKITFVAKDNFGLQRFTSTTLSVIRPAIVLSSAPVMKAQVPLSGIATLTVQVNGLGSLSGNVSFKHTLYHNGISNTQFTTNSYALDTTYLCEGFAGLQVITSLKRTTGTQWLNFTSNSLYTHIKNSTNSKAPIITVPTHNSTVYPPFLASVRFNASGVSSVTYYLINSSNAFYSMGSSTTAPSYSLGIKTSSSQFPSGTYKLIAAGSYRQTDGSYKIVYSEPITIILQQSPPSSSTPPPA